MKKRIICFGDSNTWGYIPAVGSRYPEGVRWTSLLGEYLDCTVIEEGLNGRTTVFRDSFAPFVTGSSYIEACVLSHRPTDLLIIMLGTNDMKTYFSNSPDASARGSIKIALMAKAVSPELKILLISPPPIGQHITQLDPDLGMMAQLEQTSIENSWKLGALLKTHAEMCGFWFMDAAEYVSVSAADAVHLDENGHKLLAKAIADKVREII